MYQVFLKRRDLPTARSPVQCIGKMCGLFMVVAMFWMLLLEDEVPENQKMSFGYLF